MKKVIIPLVILFLIMHSCKDCEEWYSNAELKGVSQNQNNRPVHENWYETDYLSGELNFMISYNFSANGYSECKTTETINEPEKDNISLFCSGTVIIDNDTLVPNTNLMSYFDFNVESDRVDIITYNKQSHSFPKFDQTVNNFKVIIPLTDGDEITATKVISVNE